MIFLSFDDFNFFFKFFQEHYQSPKGLDPDQPRHYVEADLGPNSLQRSDCKFVFLLKLEIF